MEPTSTKCRRSLERRFGDQYNDRTSCPYRSFPSSATIGIAGSPICHQAAAGDRQSLRCQATLGCSRTSSFRTASQTRRTGQTRTTCSGTDRPIGCSRNIGCHRGKPLHSSSICQRFAHAFEFIGNANESRQRSTNTTISQCIHNPSDGTDSHRCRFDRSRGALPCRVDRIIGGWLEPLLGKRIASLCRTPSRSHLPLLERTSEAKTSQRTRSIYAMLELL